MNLTKNVTFLTGIAIFSALAGASSSAHAAVTMDCSLGGNCFVTINPSSPVPTPYSLVWGIGGAAEYNMMCPISTSDPHSVCGFFCYSRQAASFSITVYDANSNLVGSAQYNMARCTDSWD